MRIVVAGSIGRLPLGGHAWIDMNYLAGFAALGHDVYYLEECGDEGSWVYDWEAQEVTTDLSYPADYVHASLAPLGLGDRWIYRAGDEARGMSPAEFADVCAEADLLLVRAVGLPLWRPEYERVGTVAFVDSDPGFTQMKIAAGDPHLAETARRADRLFTIGMRIGAPDCEIPTAGLEWVTTLPPIALPLWPSVPAGPSAPFTCVIQWRGYGDVKHEGRSYGDKNGQFEPFLDLPQRSGRRFLLALTGGAPEMLTRHGWEVVEGWVASSTPERYRDFIASSRAEFSVAKHGYVATRGGWFSDRSVCYLACGRPVVVQDTGLEWLVDGDGGVLPFSDRDSAVAAIEAVDADYELHSRAARQLAETRFAADRVLGALLEEL